MKLRLAMSGLLMAMALTSCSPTVTRVEEQQPAIPKPTPHPATGAQARAMQLYPDLAVKDSLFNRTFVELVDHTSQRDPLLLAGVDWPITLAHQTGKILGVTPETARPEPAPDLNTKVEVPPARPDNPLERGAYNNTRVVNPRIYYYNGSYYYR